MRTGVMRTDVHRGIILYAFWVLFPVGFPSVGLVRGVMFGRSTRLFLCVRGMASAKTFPAGPHVQSGRGGAMKLNVLSPSP